MLGNGLNKRRFNGVYFLLGEVLFLIYLTVLLHFQYWLRIFLKKYFLNLKKINPSFHQLFFEFLP